MGSLDSLPVPGWCVGWVKLGGEFRGRESGGWAVTTMVLGMASGPLLCAGRGRGGSGRGSRGSARPRPHSSQRTSIIDDVLGWVSAAEKHRARGLFADGEGRKI